MSRVSLSLLVPCLLLPSLLAGAGCSKNWKDEGNDPVGSDDTGTGDSDTDTGGHEQRS